MIMDDILIYGRPPNEHDDRLMKLFKQIDASGLKLNKEKCNFRKTELTYFGYLVGKDGMKPNLERIKAITDLPAPENVPKLQCCLGMINYLSRFIPSVSQIAKLIGFLW